MKKITQLLSTVIIVFWLVMMCLLVRKTLFIPLKAPIPAVLSDNTVEAGEEWYGIYFKNTKIGYTASSRRKTEHGYLFSESAVMDLMMMNVPQHLKTTLYSKTDTDLALRTFSFSLTSGIIKLSVSGEVVSNQMHLKIDTGGVIEDKKIVLTAVPVLESGLKYKLIGTGLSRGNKIKSTVFDPFSMSGREISAEVEGREQIYIKNKAYDCFRIRQSFNGITVYTWITDTGETLQEQSPMGFMLIQEPPDVAVSGIRSDKSIDITSATGIKSDRLLPDRTITYLKIRLLNIPLDGFALNGGRQKLTNDTVEITREKVNGSDTYAIPYEKTEYAAFLKATAFIQSDTQELSEQAKKIIQDETDAQRVIKILNTWVYAQIEKIPTLSIPSALEVLRTRRGDCNEHAVLFTALCRAVGIPARICSGVVYQGGSFYYHAWAEVFINRWITVDPVMNQFPADVTHIKFVEGDLEQQMVLLKAVGRLGIEIREYK